MKPVEVRESPTPEILYKYLPPERIDVLGNLEVRFSRPSEFNDTFDTHYLVPRSQGKTGIATRFRFKRGIGIFCLTERPDDHLMWVHYARNHTGFVLGFRANASFFREDSRTLGKVIYQKRPIVFSNAALEACFYKARTWRHEHEWRCVRAFKSSEPRTVGIKSELIREIIFGSQMESWQIAQIIFYATAHEMMSHIKFFRSSPSRRSWSLKNVQTTMSLCDSCHGDGYFMKDFNDTNDRD